MNSFCDPAAGFEKAKRTFTVLVVLDCCLFASVSVYAVDCSTADGYVGPNENTSDPALFPPDVGDVNLDSNGAGCNSIAEILGSGSEDGVFMDGFETKSL